MATVMDLDRAKRIVVKIGSALLVDHEKQVLNREWLQALVLDIVELRKKNIDVLIVSSGSIALGRQILELGQAQLSLEESQASAAVGQIALAEAYQEALAKHQVKSAQILLTSENSENRRRYLNTQATLETLLRLDVVPIVNENDTVATDEIRFGDNDQLAAQLAVMARADVLVLLSDVDGIYTANPKTIETAEHIPVVREISTELEAMAKGAGSNYSKGGMVTKLMAAKTAISGGVAMVIAQGHVLHPLRAIIAGSKVTWFLPKSDWASARKNWVRSMKTRGVLSVDKGAKQALENGSSLLAAGCRDIDGRFERGDAVDIACEGAVFARGLVGYDFNEAKAVLGLRSSEIEQRLGYGGRGALVHRDNLVILT